MSDEHFDWQDGDLKVVVNHEEQYSIWPAYRDLPSGWREAGFSGKKASCLEFIKEVWTDMRPLSLRRQMEERESRREEFEKEDARRVEEARSKPKDARDNLVQFLSEGEHPIEITLRPERSIKEFKASVDRGFVLVKFTDTRGGTELGIRLDRDACNITNGDFENGSGVVHLEGVLRLNSTKVRCIADVGLETFEGSGHLRVVTDETAK